jgi:2,3-dihydroxybiphenyl 1,2-dioxygenase
MQHDIELAYLGLEVPDPRALDPFFEELVGLVPGPDGPEGTHTWRNDDRIQRLVVQPGPRNDAAFLGFEAADPDAFERVAERLSAAGFPLAADPGGLGTSRRVSRLGRTDAPFGVAVEVVERLETAETPFVSALMPGGFLTDGVGFGHVVLATTAFEESHRFVTEGLGLAQTDWIELEIAAGIELEVRFYHCNARHHTVALAKAPFDLPQVLHHVMFEARNRDDVGAAFDRAYATDLAIPNGLGKHDNDKMFSFYVASPAGFQVEIGHGAVLVGDDWSDNRLYDRISSWGHQPVSATRQ